MKKEDNAEGSARLELKQLAPYLPYGLILKTAYGTSVKMVHYNMGACMRYKPLLVPLSECEKYLNMEGGIELDSSFLAYNDSCWSINIYPDGSEWTHSRDVYINIYEWLFQNHFDVFNLIEKGLAINKLTNE